ncbi:MAG: Hsp20/alpha crystallin family protein [Saprospiraceae bacterium]
MRLITYNPAFVNRWPSAAEDVTQSPSVNVTEKDNGFYLEVVSPGFTKEDISIEVKEKQLTISAEKKTDAENKEEGKVWRKEYSFNSFKRSFHLPNTVEGDAIQASYDQGILKIYIPKKATAETKVKTIEIA